LREIVLVKPISMTFAENLKRIHPLVAVAAVSVTLFSAVGIAAITGVLPTSQGANRDASANEVPAGVQSSRAEEVIPSDALPSKKHAPKSGQQNQAVHAQQPGVQGDGAVTAQRSPGGAGTQTQTHTTQAPAAQNSPIGIGVGAVIGGVLGNQIGSGDGKTLATIAGAIGGGYIGNEVAKRKP
jgi:uncharacterized protein YcfJ